MACVRDNKAGGRLGKIARPRLDNSTERFIKNGGVFKKKKAKDLFELKGNPQLNKESFTFSKDSKYPYFTRTVFNNGILGYVDYLDDAHLIKGNSLAVGMMGMQFFYMEHDFYAGQFTKTAFPRFEGFNEQIALWFISWFNKSSKKYLGVLVRDFENAFYETEIDVPYYGEEIALAYIEERVRELEEERVRELEAYLQAAGFSDCSLTLAEREALNKFMGGVVRNKSFEINTLFHIKKGTRLTKASMEEGTINFIGASASNNGITAKIGNTGHIHSAGTITVSYNGSVGESFYQISEFWASDDINVLYPKFKMSESLALYMLCPIRKKGQGYGYAYKWKKEIMEKDSICLPVTDDGSIDFMFMETYISAVKKQVIGRLKDFIAHEKDVYLRAIS